MSNVEVICLTIVTVVTVLSIAAVVAWSMWLDHKWLSKVNR